MTAIRARAGRGQRSRDPCQTRGTTLFRRGLKAERSGFEPEMPVSRHTGLAIRRFRPLSHLSGAIFGNRPRGPFRRAEYSRKSDANPRSAHAAHRAPNGAAVTFGGLGFASVEPSVPVGIEASKHG